MWKEFDRCLQLHSADGVELVTLFFKSSIQWISGFATRMEGTQPGVSFPYLQEGM